MINQIEPQKCLVYVGNKIKHISKTLYFFYPVNPSDELAHYLGADILDRHTEDIIKDGIEEPQAIDLHIISVSLMLNIKRSELKVFHRDISPNFKSSLYLIVQYFKDNNKTERAVYAVKKTKILASAKRKLVNYPESDIEPLKISFEINDNKESILSIEE